MEDNYMQVTFRPITKENWRDAARMDVRDDQRHFVASNLYSIAEEQWDPTWEPVAVHDGETMVGFVMWGLNPDREDEWWIIRLMIDAQYQGRGYGRAATREAIHRLRQKPGCTAIYISFEPENAVAERLYRSLGFEDTGRVEYGETVYRLALDAEMGS
jgi:diamine N-acetyltransferase